MDITINESLKRLRTAKGSTQDDLARHLGITMQAVSKWERGERYPDITLLPVIVEFYNVTVDALLGIDEMKKEERIYELLRIHRVKSKFYNAEEISDGEFTEKIGELQGFLREARREFPNDFRLMLLYMESLSPTRRGELQVNRDDYDEIVALGERILAECTDDGIRLNTQLGLCRFYAACGETEKAKEYARMTSGVWQPMTLMPLQNGDELFQTAQDSISKGFVLIIHSKLQVLRDDSGVTEEQKRELFKLIDDGTEALRNAAPQT
ncbi:MAG: helix-turn-helix domain-containing protein [Oscillospiraceae bacterium]|jgi:transcriptional regulator with XRE-family HTH domain|nr:helix-turn-helix domain-containing protein [Oscillospiraceae bacterium]